MSVLMISLKDHIYASRRLRCGAQFSARGQSDARLLVALGRARIDPGFQDAGYNTRVMTAAEPSAQAGPEFVIRVDGQPVVLDGMDIDALRELADRLGVKVHHMAREKKLTAALVESQKSA